MSSAMDGTVKKAKKRNHKVKFALKKADDEDFELAMLEADALNAVDVFTAECEDGCESCGDDGEKFNWIEGEVSESKDIDLGMMFPPGLADHDDDDKSVVRPVWDKPGGPGPAPPMTFVDPYGNVSRAGPISADWNQVSPLTN